SWHQKVMAATLSLPGAMASHRTAAFLWQLECFHGPPALIEVTVGFNHSRRLRLARVHHTRRLPEAQHRQGIATAPLARTLVDLSDVVSEETLFVAFDSARRKYPSVLARLEEELSANGAGRRHGDRLAEMANRAKGEQPTGSPLEAQTAFKLDKRRGMPRPKRQHHVHDDKGNFIARVDFAWVEQRVILQCDSRQFHLTPDAFEKDLLQRRQLESHGWRVVHVTKLMLKTQDWLVDVERLLDAQRRLALYATD
ncbi:MAG: hypothetical protein H6Q89_1444, partial [Myxococcaceae bacterium]|nr:hypothetical protein [Myxococcaceae bacterium]